MRGIDYILSSRSNHNGHKKASLEPSLLQNKE